jgi:phosphopantothenoylcysteine synthetase/decarboxylase
MVCVPAGNGAKFFLLSFMFYTRRKKMKKMALRVTLGMALAGLLMAGSAFAQAQTTQLSINPATLNTVDQLLAQMQMEMIQKNYSSMLLKDQMRGKMMAERTPVNFMQAAIQPLMMERMREQIKPQQMQIMVER